MEKSEKVVKKNCDAISETNDQNVETKPKLKAKEKIKDKSKKEKAEGTIKEKIQTSKKTKRAKDTVKNKSDKVNKNKIKPKENEQLEFTKPTINQMVREQKKRKEKKELNIAEFIENREFEDFNDEVRQCECEYECD